MRTVLTALGADPAPMTAEAFAAFQRGEVRKWGEIIRTAGVRAE